MNIIDFAGFSYFSCVTVCTAGAPRRVFCHYGGVFYCIFKHSSDINMRIPFISQNSSFIVDYDRKKNIEILKRIIKIYAFPYVTFTGRALLQYLHTQVKDRKEIGVRLQRAALL